MRRRAFAIGVALLALACQGPGLSVSELPQQPIALYYFDAQNLRRRADAIADADPKTRDQGELGIARVKDISSYLGHMMGLDSPKEPKASIEHRFPGRLALLDPRTQQIEEQPETLAGAIPLDWSRDRQRLLFSQVFEGFRQLFELDRRSGEVHPLSRGPAVHANGCYGPQRRIVMSEATVKDGQATSRIVITEPGHEPRPLSDGPADHSPACAPDGSAVAWISVDPRGRDLLVTRTPVLDGPLRILGRGRSPSFSDDSQWIAYSAPVEKRWALARIRSDGSGRHAIGTGTMDELDPSFSPDGRLVVYVANDGFRSLIYVRRFDGSGDRILLEAGGGSDPVW